MADGRSGGPSDAPACRGVPPREGRRIAEPEPRPEDFPVPDLDDPRDGDGSGDTRLLRAVSGKLLFLFILGDVLGAGIYALVGVIAGEVGGAVWAPMLVALLLALLTAASYAELVTKYPRAGGVGGVRRTGIPQAARLLPRRLLHA